MGGEHRSRLQEQEQGNALDVFGHPREFYTRQLLAAVPRLGALAGTDGPPRVLKTDIPAKPKATAPVLNVGNLSVTYGSGTGFLFKRKAATATVSDVSFDIMPGELLRESQVAAEYLPLPAAAMKVQTFTRWAKGFDRWLARTQRLDLPGKPDQGDPLSLGPKRGGVSVELVAIVWELG